MDALQPIINDNPVPDIKKSRIILHMPHNSIKYLCLLLGFSLTVHAQDIKPFSTDGCSLFPNGVPNDRTRWLACCTQHDIQYWQGGSEQQRIESDKQLLRGVEKTGQTKIALLMHQGVRVGGAPYWPVPYRWGYGWTYLRGYKLLTKQEKQSVKRALEQYHAKQAASSSQHTP